MRAGLGRLSPLLNIRNQFRDLGILRRFASEPIDQFEDEVARKELAMIRKIER